MNTFIKFAAALLVMFTSVFHVSLVLASETTGIGFQVSAGNFKTDANKTFDFEAGRYGSVTGEATNSDPSIAGRAVFRVGNGIEIGLGARTGSNQYAASEGSAASADRAANDAKIQELQEDIEALDTNSPTYDSDVAALEDAKVPFMSDNEYISSVHVADTNEVGASLTVMRFAKAGQGEIGLGSEAFIGKEGTVAAAKVAYRDQMHSGINLGVEAYVGDDWAGAAMTADF